VTFYCICAIFFYQGDEFMDNKKIGSFIAQTRKAQGLNQKELAQKISVSDKAVSKWETGRGIPDVSLLQPLSFALGVSVEELLNGERMPQQENTDEKIIKKLKIKKYIQWAIEIVITIIFCYVINMFHNTFYGYKNVLDSYLHKNEIYFLSICSIIVIAVFVVWLLTVIITAIAKKKAAVFKTIIVCLSFSFVVGCSLKMASFDDSRYKAIYDEPVKSVDYVDYSAFFDDDYETQITIMDTNDIITQNYSAYFDNADVDSTVYNFVNTRCVEILNSDALNLYYNQRKSIITDNCEQIEMDSSLCSKLGITQGYYLANIYNSDDIELYFIKGNAYYEIEISNSSIDDSTLVNQIIAL
jgi:transcriptional regulator with XRE-family HTH domain